MTKWVCVISCILTIGLRVVFAVHHSPSSHHSSDGSSSLPWFEYLREDDNKRFSGLMLDLKSQLGGIGQTEAKELLYQTLASPFRSYCTSLKSMGGRWHKDDGATDGRKFVCMDQWENKDVFDEKEITSENHKDDEKEVECLVYSLGVGDDTSFDEAMGDLGCEVKMFDPSVVKPHVRQDLQQRLKWFPVEITRKIQTDKWEYSKNENKSTLPDLIRIYQGDGHRIITYLKVDIEGEECEALGEWIKSGILKNVRQIGIEFHLFKSEDKLSFGRKKSKDYRAILGSIYALLNLGFINISYDANLIYGNKNGKYFECFDVVFVNKMFTN